MSNWSPQSGESLLYIPTPIPAIENPGSYLPAATESIRYVPTVGQPNLPPAVVEMPRYIPPAVAAAVYPVSRNVATAAEPQAEEIKYVPTVGANAAREAWDRDQLNALRNKIPYLGPRTEFISVNKVGLLPARGPKGSTGESRKPLRQRLIEVANRSMDPNEPSRSINIVHFPRIMAQTYHPPTPGHTSSKIQYKFTLDGVEVSVIDDIRTPHIYNAIKKLREEGVPEDQLRRIDNEIIRQQLVGTDEQ